MKYTALVSFSGVISMAYGDVREISDVSVANDLLKAGYIVPLGNSDIAKEKPKKTTKRKGKKEKENDGN